MSAPQDAYLIPVRPPKPPLENLGEATDCPLCGWHAPIHHGHISDFHLTENGSPCDGAGMCVTTEAAIARDNRLNPHEKAVYDAMRRRQMVCRGVDQVTGELCDHPVCAERRAPSNPTEQLALT